MKCSPPPGFARAFRLTSRYTKTYAPSKLPSTCGYYSRPSLQGCESYIGALASSTTFLQSHTSYDDLSLEVLWWFLGSALRQLSYLLCTLGICMFHLEKQGREKMENWYPGLSTMEGGKETQRSKWTYQRTYQFIPIHERCRSPDLLGPCSLPSYLSHILCKWSPPPNWKHTALSRNQRMFKAEHTWIEFNFGGKAADIHNDTHT